VSSRPSETGVYGMTPDIKSFLKAANPLLTNPRSSTKFVRGVSATSSLLVMRQPKNIPDGIHRWTRIPLNILSFPDDATISKVTLNLNLSTTHRGDLVVALMGPGGVQSILHNGEGAGADDLIFEDYDVSGPFAGGEPDGRWTLLVQDRLTGDPAVVTRFELEIAAE
jgi:subtilisin-like proprotein convertase family protein